LEDARAWLYHDEDAFEKLAEQLLSIIYDPSLRTVQREHQNGRVLRLYERAQIMQSQTALRAEDADGPFAAILCVVLEGFSGVAEFALLVHEFESLVHLGVLHDDVEVDLLLNFYEVSWLLFPRLLVDATRAGREEAVRLLAVFLGKESLEFLDHLQLHVFIFLFVFMVDFVLERVVPVRGSGLIVELAHHPLCALLVSNYFQAATGLLLFVELVLKGFARASH